MLAALRRRHYSTFQAVNRVDGRRKRLSKWVECEIILLNRENSVFQVHVLNWVHPCQAVNNGLSLLPLPVWLGGSCITPSAEWDIVPAALLLSPAHSRGMQELLSSKGSVGWLQPPASAAAVLVPLAPYGLAAVPLKAPRNPPGQENEQFGCVRALAFGRTRCSSSRWGWLPSFLWLEIDILAASACTCQYEQTQELFFASHMIEWMALMELKFCSDHNDTVRREYSCSFLMLSCVRFWNAHISLSFKSL